MRQAGRGWWEFRDAADVLGILYLSGHRQAVVVRKVLHLHLKTSVISHRGKHLHQLRGAIKNAYLRKEILIPVQVLKEEKPACGGSDGL